MDIYNIPKSKLGFFMDNVRSPLTIGNIELSDGRTVKGFLCEEYALKGSENITKYKKF